MIRFKEFFESEWQDSDERPKSRWWPDEMDLNMDFGSPRKDNVHQKDAAKLLEKWSKGGTKLPIEQMAVHSYSNWPRWNADVPMSKEVYDALSKGEEGIKNIAQGGFVSPGVMKVFLDMAKDIWENNPEFSGRPNAGYDNQMAWHQKEKDTKAALSARDREEEIDRLGDVEAAKQRWLRSQRREQNPPRTNTPEEEQKMADFKAQKRAEAERRRKGL